MFREIEAPIYTDIEIEPTNELIASVYETRTLRDGYPLYANADINLVSFYADQVYPSAKYVLSSSVRRIVSYAELVQERNGINILNLEGRAYLPETVIAPPIVEISDGVPTIVDGMHRFYVAKKLGVPVTAVLINGVDPDFPLISYPVEWREVKKYWRKPNDPRKLRNLREGIADTSEDLTTYFRDLSYLGSTGRRPRSGQRA